MAAHRTKQILTTIFFTGCKLIVLDVLPNGSKRGSLALTEHVTALMRPADDHEKEVRTGGAFPFAPLGHERD
jgi:hypothetical protein